jgi:hypothetical protein
MFQNPATLKSELEKLDILPNASLFTYNAVATYTSINTADCLTQLLEYFSDTKVSSKYGFAMTALLEAFDIVMCNNHMRFCDIIVKQISRISIGMSLVMDYIPG